MAKFIVDRKTWMRGNRHGSSLLNSDGLRCCIGFVAQQCGVSDRDLLNTGTLKTLDRDLLSNFPIWMRESKWINANKEFADIYKAYQVNDQGNTPDDEREILLKEIFKRNGDEIEFTN